MSSTPIFVLAVMLIGSYVHVGAGNAFPFLPPGNEYQDAIVFAPEFIFLGSFITNLNTYGDSGLSFNGKVGINVLCCNLQNKKEGVQIRLSTDAEDLQKVARLAQQYQQFGLCYTPLWVYVATWDNVSTTTEDGQGGNTFQAVLAFDGQKSFALFDFGSVSAGAADSDVKIIHPYMGTTFYLCTNYSIASATDLPTESNIGVPGRFLFRLDEADIGFPTPTAEADKCKGACEGGLCYSCKPHEYFSKSQRRCIPKCGPCSSVGEYAEYPGVKWEGVKDLIILQFERPDAMSARSECQTQCTGRIFCTAFTLVETGDSTECTLLQSALSASKFTYDQSGATFFHKKCK